MNNNFEDEGGISQVTKYLQEQIEKDFENVDLPQDIKEGIKKLSELRITLLETDALHAIAPSELMTMQNQIAGHKYYIGRQVSLLAGAQSYAYIYRKFKVANEYNPTKERLAKGQEKAPTVGQIENSLEQTIVNERKSEVAFQVVCDRLKVLLSWCDDIILIIQNKLREHSNTERTRYTGDSQ